MFHNLMGWAGPDTAKREIVRLGYDHKPLQIFGGDNVTVTKVALYDFWHKALNGGEPKLYAQLIGDCTANATKNCINTLQCVQMCVNGTTEGYREVHPSYIYGIERVQIGGGQLGRQDGGVGLWCSQGTQKYGVLAMDEPGVPAYTASLAQQWGATGPPQKWIDIATKNLVKQTTQINSWDECCDAIIHMAAQVSVCSNIGFEMMPRADGYHYPGPTWSHNMSIIMCDKKSGYGLVQNNWGDVHGHLKDFDTGEPIPYGMLRVHAETIDQMLKQGDSWAYNSFDDWESKADILQKSLFDLGGD